MTNKKYYDIIYLESEREDKRMNSMIILLMTFGVMFIGACVAWIVDWYTELKEERKRKSPNRTKPW